MRYHAFFAGIGAGVEQGLEVEKDQLLQHLGFGKGVGDLDEGGGRRLHVRLGQRADLVFIGIEILEIAAEEPGEQRDCRETLGDGQPAIEGLNPRPESGTRRDSLTRRRVADAVLARHPPALIVDAEDATASLDGAMWDGSQSLGRSFRPAATR